MLDIKPKTAALITTYKCTAMCKDCCFSCSPREREMLSLQDIHSFIDDISQMNSVEMMVWSGGECTLLKDNLNEGIAYAFSKGIPSRIVSNASWSKGIEKDREYLLKLKSKGLAEVNISTGDMHQQFVSIDKVLSVVFAAISINLRAIVYIEKTKISKFTLKSLKEHPLYLKIINADYNNLFTVISAPWVSINSGNIYEYDEQAFLEKSRGCDSLYKSVALNPDGNFLSCCGLTVRYIPEMRIGNVKEGSLIRGYENQKTDFMKQWLFVEGPVNILKQVVTWDESITIPKFVHPCQACAYIFQSPEVIDVIEKNYTLILDQITKKFKQKLNYDLVFQQKLNS